MRHASCHSVELGTDPADNTSIVSTIFIGTLDPGDKLGGRNVPRGLTLLHDLCPIVYLIGVTQLFLGLEDRTGGAAPWMTSLASAA